MAAICDVDAGRLGEAAAESRRPRAEAPATHAEDFRRILDDKAIDAVVRRHAAPLALPRSPCARLQAGKHVYVEKPASHVYREGQLLVEAAEKSQAHRAARHADALQRGHGQGAARCSTSGVLGEVKMAKAWNVQRHSHRPPVPDAAPPKGVNYDLWLGPAPKRPFNPNRFHGNWQWYRDYGNGDIGNDGVHDIDMACMGLGVDRLPVRITAHGSRIDLTGEREYPDNMMVTYQFDNDKVLIYEDRGWTPYGMHGFDSGNAFYGTKGYMIFSRRGYFQVYLGRKEEPRARPCTATPASAAAPGELPRLRPRRGSSRTPPRRRPTSCALVHLGEIAYRTERVLHFDPATERVTGDKEADALLTKEYRAPWGLPGEPGESIRGRFRLMTVTTGGRTRERSDYRYQI